MKTTTIQTRVTDLEQAKKVFSQTYYFPIEMLNKLSFPDNFAQTIDEILDTVGKAEKDAFVLLSYGLSIADIGKILGVDQEEVRILCRRAERKMHHPSRMRRLEYISYLDTIMREVSSK